jgi:two-component sensor histidine kinase
LVNEIITNSFKHAFKGNKEGIIQLTASTFGNTATVEIKDNGVGLPENYKQLLSDTNSLGFELISILTQQINAEMEIENNGGATFKFTFAI